MPIDIARGLSDVARGARLIAGRPRLWGWVIAPALLSLLIIVALIGAAVSYSGDGIDWLSGQLPGFLASLLSGLLTILLVLILVVAGYFVFFSMSALVAAPFNEMLSESIEEQLTGEDVSGFSPLRFVRDLLVGLLHAARRVIVYLLLMGGLLVASLLLPVIGQALYLVGAALVSARFAAYDAFDAVFARKGWAYRDKISFLRTHRARTSGLGGAVALWMLVPGLNLLALSSGAAGATLAYLDLVSSSPRSTPRDPDVPPPDHRDR